MGYSLGKEQQMFITRLVKAGRFNNQSEAVREAIRRMQRQETEYLTPSPLTPAQVEAIYDRKDTQTWPSDGLTLATFGPHWVHERNRQEPY